MGFPSRATAALVSLRVRRQTSSRKDLANVDMGGSSWRVGDCSFCWSDYVQVREKTAQAGLHPGWIPSPKVLGLRSISLRGLYELGFLRAAQQAADGADSVGCQGCMQYVEKELLAPFIIGLLLAQFGEIVWHLREPYAHRQAHHVECQWLWEPWRAVALLLH